MKRGTRRWRRFLRREPHNASWCDSMCDAHSGRGDRRHARARGDRITDHEIASGIEVHAIEHVDTVIACIVPAC